MTSPVKEALGPSRFPDTHSSGTTVYPGFADSPSPFFARFLDVMPPGSRLEAFPSVLGRCGKPVARFLRFDPDGIEMGTITMTSAKVGCRFASLLSEGFLLDGVVPHGCYEKRSCGWVHLPDEPFSAHAIEAMRSPA